MVAFAQNGTLKGKITDHSTNEPIIGAYIYISDEYRSKADIDGFYTIKNLPYGEYEVKVSMFSYDTLITKVTINAPTVTKDFAMGDTRSEEHTSELQSRPHLVCRLLLEKKKKKPTSIISFNKCSYKS